ncbi:hypothetical protein C8J56DRAFT_161157 [Mycena floridula]|nr:hypothetical protein C8J56DRAFT_161157 [Mycena floridula]
MVISSVCLWSFTAVQMAILRAPFSFRRIECIAKAVSTEMPLKACFAILIAYHLSATSCTKRRICKLSFPCACAVFKCDSSADYRAIGHEADSRD